MTGSPQRFWSLVLIGALAAAALMAASVALLQANLHDAAERSAGTIVVEGPATAHGQVFYLTDGLRQVWCPNGGDFMDCKWLDNRRDCK